MLGSSARYCCKRVTSAPEEPRLSELPMDGQTFVVPLPLPVPVVPPLLFICCSSAWTSASNACACEATVAVFVPPVDAPPLAATGMPTVDAEPIYVCANADTGKSTASNAKPIREIFVFIPVLWHVRAMAQ